MLVDKTAYLLSLIQVLGGATFLLILLPLYVWRNYLKDWSYTYRFVFVVLVQNAFLINLVLLLGFLGICNHFTALLGMASFYIPLGWHFSDKQFFRRWQKRLDSLLRVAYGRKRFFTLREEVGRWFLESWQQLWALPLWGHIKQNWLEYLFLFCAVIYNVWFLSYNEFHSYQFSDIPVHQSWIHALDQGTLFVDGIYPFGMHAIIYLIHKLFFLDLRETLLYFGVFQTVLLMLSFHILSKALFRWQFGAYITTICFSFLLRQGRYAAALPQECGVFALVLAGWSLINFFRIPLEKRTLKSDSRIQGFFRFKQYLNRQYLNTELLLFTLAVALTISYHFYTAIAACILVLAFFAAYSFRMVKKQYWVPIIAAGILGVLLAVSPFLACYAKGIPFQKSMGWAMSVIQKEKWEDSDPDYQEQLEASLAGNNQNNSIEEIKPEQMQKTHSKTKDKSLLEKLLYYYDTVFKFSYTVMFGKELASIFVICMALGSIFGGILLCFYQTRLAGANYFTLLFYVAAMGIIGAARVLDIVEIMDSSRAMTFTNPFLGIIFTMPLDFIFCLLGHYKNYFYQRFLYFASIVLCLGLVFIIFQRGWVHDFFEIKPAYYNEADYLVKQIRETYKPYTFTIVSPVEEYYQVVDYGYHENISKFIYMADGGEEEYKIPTPYVFFFIEKRVLDDYYYGNVEVDIEYALKDYYYMASSKDYYFQRAIIESKAYYWAQEFQKMYPNAFKVFFENEIYIAYVLKQNPFSLYNFQIDYLPKRAGKQ